jgi:hypothetical protein
MTTRWDWISYGDVMVCTDCYFAYHYGMTEVDEQWFAGESDSPADRKPLGLLDGYDVSDNTNSETGDGIDEFSSSWCQGCGSTLGGARYRLALMQRVQVTS